MEHDERRRFFRINDKLHLHYQIISAKDAVKSSFVSDDILTNFSLSVVLDMMNEDTSKLLPRIEQSDPLVGEYLAILDKKFDLLSQYLLRQSTGAKDDPLRQVKISASGVAFECRDQFKIKDNLELRILLPYCKSVVVVCSEIVNVRQNSSSNKNARPFTIAAKFLNLKSQDQELLIKYVVKRQMEQIREVKQHERDD